MKYVAVLCVPSMYVVTVSLLHELFVEEDPTIELSICMYYTTRQV